MRKWSPGLSKPQVKFPPSQLERQRAPHQDPFVAIEKGKAPRPIRNLLDRRPKEQDEASPLDMKQSDYDDDRNFSTGTRRDDRPNRTRNTKDERKQKYALDRTLLDDLTNTNGPKPAKKYIKKTVVEKKVVRDVYIPSTVSVGALARLLGVKLGEQNEAFPKNTSLKYNRGVAEQDDSSWNGRGGIRLWSATYVSLWYPINRSPVLTSEYAALLVEDFGRNAVVSDEAAFDLHPLYESPLAMNFLHLIDFTDQ